MKMKFRVIAGLAIVFFVLELRAQSNKITPVTPEAAALAKMVNYPVDLNTGVPSISVPFYTIKVGGLELPVNFDYNASGFKLNERSTRLGLGWSLSADIQISRSINGLDDFQPNVGYIANSLVTAYTPGTMNYPFLSAGRNAYDLAAFEKDAAPDKFNYKLLNKAGSFFFQKNGSGGYSIVTVPFDNLKITYSNNSFIIVDTDGTTYHFAEPQLTGQTLQQSLAAGREQSGTIINSPGPTCSSCNTTAWKCKKIVNNTGTDEITFSYGSKTIERYASFSERIEFYDNPNPCEPANYYVGSAITGTTYEGILNNFPFWELSSPKYMEIFANEKAQFHLPYFDNGNLVDKVVPKESPTTPNFSSVAGLSLSAINFRGGSVSFSSSDQLTFIELKDVGNNPLKEVYFYQTFKAPTYVPESQYFNGSDFQGTLYLDSLHIKGEGVTEERYAMLYKDKFCFGDHLKGKDAWGYPNESTVEIESANLSPYLAFSTKSIIQPQVSKEGAFCYDYEQDVLLSFGGANWSEESSNEAMQHGILKRLIYPTGGFVDFDFEANQYKEVYSTSPVWALNLPRYCGGLRIRSIGYFDGLTTAPKSYTYYRYGEYEEGTGIMVSKPAVTTDPYQFHYSVATDVQRIAYVQVFNGVPCADKSCMGVITAENKTTYRPTSFHNYTYASGSPIYYTKVTEYKQDLGKQSGKTVHEFYHPEYFHDWQAPMLDKERIPDTDLSYIKAGWMEGLQKSTSIYKFTEDAGFELINRKSFEYNRVIKSQVLAAYTYFTTIYNVVQGDFTGNNWDLYDESKSFMDNSGGYDNYRTGEYGIPVGKMLLTKETEETFDGPSNVLTTTQQYSYNSTYLQISSILTIDSKGHEIIKSFKYSYDFTGIYDQMRIKNMISQPIEEIVYDNTAAVEISRKKTNYASFTEGPGFIAPENMQTSNGGAPLVAEIVFNKYDQYANILQLTARNGIPISYLWGYNYLYPVAELNGVEYSTIPSTYLSNAGIITPVSDNALRMILSGLRSSFTGNKLINTYTHKKLIGITSQTSPNGQTNYYEYDTYGRLVATKDLNQHVTKTLAYQMAGPTALSLTKYYVNFPLMKTHNFICNNGSSNISMVYNYYVPAGKYSYSDEYSANNEAQLDALTGDGRDAPCTPTPDLGTIKLFSLHDYSFVVPKVEIDFIQNGSVVASQTFFNNSLSLPPFQDKILKLPPGDYTISFRVAPSTPFFDVFIDFYFQAVTEGYGKGLQSNDTITIVKDKVYEINVTNIM